MVWRSSLLCLLFLAPCLAQKVVQVETYTADENDGSMGIFGGVFMQMINIDFQTCEFELEGHFSDGEITVFTGPGQLGECYDFPAPNYEMPKVLLRHTGTDGWTCQYVKVVFDNGNYVTCPDGYHLDGDEVHDLDCA